MSKINKINELMIQLYKDDCLYPISLKQIIGDGNIEYSNLEKTTYNHHFELNPLPCDFNINDTGEFITKEIGLFTAKNIDTNNNMNFQVRGFPHGFTTAQTEITSSGEETGGRVGKVPTREVDRILAEYNYSRIKSIKEFNNFDWDSDEIEKYTTMIKNVNGDSKFFMSNIDNWLIKTQTDAEFKATLCIKLQGLIVANFLKINENNISNILTSFLLSAKKIGSDSGFFIKIY